MMEGEESSLSELLEHYWERLPKRAKKLASELKLLKDAYSLLHEELKELCVPAFVREESGDEVSKSERKKVLVIFAKNSTAQLAVKLIAGELINGLKENFQKSVDEVRVLIRPKEEIERVRSFLEE